MNHIMHIKELLHDAIFLATNHWMCNTPWQLAILLFLPCSSCKKCTVGWVLLFAETFNKVRKFAERVTPSLQLASLFSICVNLLQVARKIASCNSTLRAHQNWFEDVWINIQVVTTRALHTISMDGSGNNKVLKV